MAKPDYGTVLTPSVPADISEEPIKEACWALVDHGVVPRRLTVGPDDVIFCGMPKIMDLAHKFGLVVRNDPTFEYCEWTVDDLEPRESRITFWSKGV